MHTPEQHPVYKIKTFDLSGLNGISDETTDIHLKLYAGYIEATNVLVAKLAKFVEKKEAAHQNMAEYSGLKRRLAFELNGMLLHEHYFSTLKKNGGDALSTSSAFYKKAEESFGTFDTWKLDFINTGKIRGVGWVICYQDPTSGNLSNHWISGHEDGHIVGSTPLLVMDMWEHAYFRDYKPDEKASYMDAFFSNINWSCVENRLT